MAHGTPTGPDSETDVPVVPKDSGFDVHEWSYVTDALAAEARADAAPAVLPATASTVPKLILRFPPSKPQSATAAPRHPHNAPIPTSPRHAPFVQPVVSQTPVVPQSTLSGIPLPSCVAWSTPAAIVATTANAATDTLKKPSVTQTDMDALALGDTIVSISGTTREIMAIDWDKFTFRRTKRITGVELTYFATQPVEWEEKWDQINFANMKQSDHVYNGGIEYTIKSILKTSEKVVLEVVLSHMETVENYRAQWFAHIHHIDKKKKFPKVIGVEPPAWSTDWTAPTA